MTGQSNKKTAELDVEAMKAQIIEERKAEARKIIAEAKRKVEEPNPVVDEDGEKPVTIRLPLKKGAGAVFVAVNGENVLIPRGEEFTIKKKFYDVLIQSERQNEYAMKLIQGLGDEYESKKNNM